MRGFLVILAGLAAACGPAHHQNTTRTPIPERTETGPTELFLVVDLDGEYYIQMDSPGLAGLVDPKGDVLGVEMVFDEEGWAFIGTLNAAAAFRVHRALGLLGPIEVMDAARPAEDVFLGAPVLVGRVVPHFGEVQELEDRDISIDDEDQGELRRQLLLGTSPVIMIPIQGEVYDVMTLWARTRSDARPAVAVFDMGPDGPRDDEAAEVAAETTAWAEALARVDRAYAADDAGEPPYTEEDLWSARRLDDEDEPVGPNWIYFFCHYGETLCEQGPDEALLAALWAPGAPLDKPLVFVTGQGEQVVLEPYLIGDLDGDGAVELIGRTNELTGELQLLRVEEGRFKTLKSAAPMYRDCPC